MTELISHSAPPIRVLLADDHAVVRKGIREFLEIGSVITVVAEASDGLEALRLIREHRPDVAVLDIQMPGQTGIDVTRALRAEGLPVGILILTAFDDEPYVRAVLQAGANGYVLKTAEAQEIVEAVRAVYEGQSALDPAIARKLSPIFQNSNRPRSPTPSRSLNANWTCCAWPLKASLTKPSARNCQSAIAPFRDIWQKSTPNWARPAGRRP